MPVLLDGEKGEATTSALLFADEGDHNNYSSNTINQHFAEKRQKTIPLGKALHLLLNVKVSVINTAVATLNSAKSANDVEFIAILSESPAVKAIYSIDQYMKHDNGTQKPFLDIYQSLRGKILLKNPAASALAILRYLFLKYESVQQWLLSHELQQCGDRKTQLAVIILLQFVFKHQEPGTALYLADIATKYLPPLVDILKRLSETSPPTYLACTVCEVAIDLCRHLLGSVETNKGMQQSSSPVVEAENKHTSAKIVEIPTEPDSTISNQPLVSSTMQALIEVLEQWHNPTSPIEKAAYRDLYRLLKQPQQTALDWAQFWTYFTPKSVLSKKPFTVKKQKQLFSKSQSGFLLLCLFERKAGWLENSDIEPDEKEPNNSEKDDMQAIKDCIRHAFSDLVSASTSTTTSTSSSTQFPAIIPQLIKHLPESCPAEAIHDADLIQHILKETGYSTAMIPLVVNQPESTLFSLLWQVVGKTGTAEATAAYNLLRHVIQQNPSEQVISFLEKELLTVAKESDDACKLLIECMPFVDLPALIQKLMIRVANKEDNEKEKMIYCALIYKALLQEKWAHYSILWYIDYVRELEIKKSIECVEQQMQRILPASPKQLFNWKPQSSEAATFAKSAPNPTMQTLMIPIQLWGLRQEDSCTFRTLIRQLVAYCYGLPHDPQLPNKLIWIPTWHQLSFGLSNGPQAPEVVPTLIQSCLKLMTMQDYEPHPRDDELAEKRMFLKLCPMLIMQSMRKEAFAFVELPKKFVTIISERLRRQYAIEEKDIKIATSATVSEPHMALYVQLIEQLSNRPLNEPIEVTRLVESLITKIFCK